MRLFVALELPAELRSRLAQAAQSVRLNSAASRLTRPENMHITLAFIGECTAAQPAVAAIERTRFTALTYTLGCISCFRRSGGDICIVPVRAGAELVRLQAQLTRELERAGFVLERRRFSPHITLARQVTLLPGADYAGFESLENLPVQRAGSIALFDSRRCDARVVYTKLFERKGEEL